MAPPSALKSALPDTRQALLLQACLATDPQKAAELGRRWLTDFDVENIDFAEQRLLGLLGWQLAHAHADHPEMLRLRGYQKHCWASNHTLLHRVRPIIESLTAAGIPVIVLKGLPLAFSVYPDPGTRPMEDADLLVPSAQGEAAMKHLLALGCRRTSPEPPVVRGWAEGGVLSFNYASHFQTAQGLNIDLHWHSLDECCHRNADDSFWARRVTLPVPGGSLQTLSVEDQLFHTCIHGMRANETSSIRWIIDAAWLIRRHPGLKWEVLVEEARTRKLSFTLARALDFLNSMGDIPIPAGIPEHLRDQIASPMERWEHLSNVSTSRWVKAAGLWMRFLRATPQETQGARLLKFPTFLRLRWGVESFSGMLSHIWRRTRRV